MSLQSEQIDKIIPALIKARGSFKAAVKDAQNPHFKSAYVTLDGVVDAITDALLANGIFCTQQTDIADARTVLHTRFLHTSGQWIGSVYPVHPIKADPQGEGSALTYARRYALMALAGIAPEDDDGNAAAKAANSVQADQATEAKTQKWIYAIGGCGTAEELDSIAAQLKTCGLPKASMTKIRAAWATQKNAVTKKAA